MKSADVPVQKDSSQRGLSLPMVALFIFVLFAMASLAVDLGIMYTGRTSAQHAADAAALAGAYSFVANPSAPQPDTAYKRAIAVAAQNKILATPVSITTPVNTPPCPTSNATSWVCVNTVDRRVTVNVARVGSGNNLVTYFAKAMGWNSVDVATIAAAEAGPQVTGTYCLKPMYLPINNNWNDSSCTGSIFDATGNLKPSLVGTQTTMWVKSNKSPLLVAGDDGLLTVTVNPGGSGVEGALSDCAGVVVSCNENVIVSKPGGNNGPVSQGVEDLITVGGTRSPDTWYSVGKYCDQGNCSILKDTSPSLVTVAVWNCVADKPGRGDFYIAGFAQVFVDGPVNSPSNDGTSGGIQVHLVSASSCGMAGGGGGGNTGTGPGGYPVRLVRPSD